MQKLTPEEHAEVIDRCLEAYLQAGTLELSLDQLGSETGTTKRMLVHYFGNRQEIEERAIALFEKRLEERFQADRFSEANTLRQAAVLLWEQLTEPAFQPSLRLLYDLFHAALRSERAWSFHDRQLTLWTEVLLRHTADHARAEALATALKALAWASLDGSPIAQCRALLERVASS